MLELVLVIMRERAALRQERETTQKAESRDENNLHLSRQFFPKRKLGLWSIDGRTSADSKITFLMKKMPMSARATNTFTLNTVKRINSGMMISFFFFLPSPVTMG